MCVTAPFGAVSKFVETGIWTRRTLHGVLEVQYYCCYFLNCYLLKLENVVAIFPFKHLLNTSKK